MIQNNKLIRRVFGWYFSKKVLPYWVILIADAAIVFFTTIFIYWLTNDDYHIAVLDIALFFVLFC